MTATTAPSVLFVDDDPLVLSAQARVLARRGVRVATACGGAAALELIRQHRFELIVCDVRMPDVDGRKVLECACEHGCGRFVFVTGFADRSHDALLEEGADEVLQKPVPIERFLALVEDLSGRRVAEPLGETG